ncbi:hypothetical protein CTI12_AA406920 [Artemisia annua]|uniref:RRM domain-containing protein n=1 Tax=Artemisia annua TaxID=35608 RepID=A0A2U1M8W8_ARTAN|nr:hypothetical protein CTI12_AA406920 [Artemisia annua]
MAHEVWKKLKDLFHDNKASRVIQLDNEIRNMAIGTSSVNDYFQDIKSKADRLANLGSPVSDSSLVTYAINGLRAKFPDIARIIRHRDELPTFDKVRSMVLLEEADMAQLTQALSSTNLTSSSPTVLVATTPSNTKSGIPCVNPFMLLQSAIGPLQPNMGIPGFQSHIYSKSLARNAIPCTQLKSQNPHHDQVDEHQEEETFTCEICIELVPNKKFKNSNRCVHPCCSACMIKYIQVKLEDNVSGNAIPCTQLKSQNPHHDQVDEHQEEETFTCEICIELVPNKKFKNSNRCVHPCCSACMIKYIQVKLEDNVSEKSGKGVPSVGIVLNVFMVATILNAVILEKVTPGDIISFVHIKFKGNKAGNRVNDIKDPNGFCTGWYRTLNIQIWKLHTKPTDQWPEDLRRPFGQFGPLKDIYLPRDYYSGEPRGFGFVQFLDPADAAEAKYQMDGQVLQGRQLTVVFAEENRKKPTDMRTRERRGGRFNDRRRSPPPRYSRSPPPRYSRSPPPRYARSRSNSREYSPPPKRKQHVRSISPGEKRHSRERSYSRSPPPARGRSPPPRSPVVDNRSPPYNGSRSPSPLPPRERSRSPVRERARAPRDPSHSPVPRDYSPSP